MLTLTAVVALLGWIPVVVLLFLLLPTRRATVVAFVLGWLLLPQAEIKVPGALPDYDRGLAISFAVLLALIVLDFERLWSFRPRLIDVPIVVWCTCPFLSSISNGLGVYDGISGVMGSTLSWGLPYFLGRIYFCDAEGLRQLAIGLFLGGLLYVPLCAYEIRMSPQIHKFIYGWYPHGSGLRQAYRLGGWRPSVFLAHGLAVGLYMSMATVMGGWLWITGALRRFEGLSLLMLLALAGTTVLCRSTGALLLLFLGTTALLLNRQFKLRWPFVLLMLIPLVYMPARISGAWHGEGILPLVERANPRRAKSLRFRLDNERILADKALQQPVFGWGRWSRHRVTDDKGKDISVTDGEWIIAMGQRGYVGLIALTLCFLLPVFFFIRRVPPDLWAHPQLAAVTVMALYLVLYMIDNLLNAMYSPFSALVMGGLGGLVAGPALRGLGKRGPSPVPSEPAPKREAVGDLDPSYLTAQALARWGEVELARREALLADALGTLEADPNGPDALRLRWLILTLGPSQLERFVGLSPEDRVSVIERLAQESS